MKNFPHKKKKHSLSSLLENFFYKISGISNIPIKHVKFSLIIFTIGMTTIFRGHYYDKKIKKIKKFQIETENLRTKYIILKSNYEYNSALSQVEKRANQLGLFSFKEPPKILK